MRFITGILHSFPPGSLSLFLFVFPPDVSAHDFVHPHSRSLLSLTLSSLSCSSSLRCSSYSNLFSFLHVVFYFGGDFSAFTHFFFIF